MDKEEPVRLVVHISPTLHKRAKATAALRGLTLRALVEASLADAIGDAAGVDPKPAAPAPASVEGEEMLLEVMEKNLAELTRRSEEQRARLGLPPIL